MKPPRFLHVCGTATAHILRRSISANAAPRPSNGGAAANPRSKRKLAPLQERKMVDKFRLHVHGGQGGAGCTSFRKGRQSRHGSADGGNGGWGGDVILVGSSALWDLSNLQHHLNGKSGGQGSSKKRVGSRGVDRIVQVPVGTVIHLVRGTIPGFKAAVPAAARSERVFDASAELGDGPWPASPGLDLGGGGRGREGLEGVSDALEESGGGPCPDSSISGGGGREIEELKRISDASEEESSAPCLDSPILDGGGRGREGFSDASGEARIAPCPTSPVFSGGRNGPRGDPMGRSMEGINPEQDFRPNAGLDSLRDEREASSADTPNSPSVSDDFGSPRYNSNTGPSPSNSSEDEVDWDEHSEAWSEDFSTDDDHEEENSHQEVQESVAEFTSPGQSIIVARGGSGGKGNAAVARGRGSEKSFPSLDHELGQPGTEADLILELKAIADVGLVGAPNAGKSTLLGALSRAKPVCGHYKFTTLRPNIGMVEFDDFYSLTVADIPGLLDGAHQNRGLGHAFLRHIERTKVLAYVVDLAGGIGFDVGPRPWDQLESLVYELEQYQAGLSRRPSVIVANKIDEDGAGLALETLREKAPHLEIYPVCAVLDEGVEALKVGIRKLVESLPGVEATSLSRPREV